MKQKKKKYVQNSSKFSFFLCHLQLDNVIYPEANCMRNSEIAFRPSRENFPLGAL